jgi:hypothetical protein
MKRALSYGDLGVYVNNRRIADKHDKKIAGVYNAWNAFAHRVPGLAATTISDEATDKILRQFAENAQSELKESTINTYSSDFRRGLAFMLQHVELTGSLDVEPAGEETVPAAPEIRVAPKRKPIYDDFGEYLVAYQEDNPGDETAKRWAGAYKAVMLRVPDAAEEHIDPETTEQILTNFGKIAIDAKATKAAAKAIDYDDAAAEALKRAPIIKISTMRHYQGCFRKALEHYCEVRHFPYTPIDTEERRQRSLAFTRERKARQAQEAAEAEERTAAKIEAARIAAAAEVARAQTEAALGAETAVEDEAALAEYTFLLRPGVIVGLNLPDDLTRDESDRLSQWIGAFVIE